MTQGGPYGQGATPWPPREDDEERRDPEPSNVPVPAGQPGGSGGLIPIEQVSAAMQMQVEILRKMNERQERIEDAVKDTQRSEMMLSSTRSLNESFRGMRRVQEKLIDELQDDDRGRRGRLLLLGGILILAGGITWGFWKLVTTVESTGARLEGNKNDQVVESQFKALQAQIERIEDDRQAKLKADLEARMISLGEAIADLKQERDEAHKREQDARTERDVFRGELVEWKKRTEEAQTEARRLTEENLGNHKLIDQLSAALERYRGNDNGGSTAPPKETAKGINEGGPTLTTEQAGAILRRGAPLPPAGLKALNAMLADHRGSESYVLRRVGAADGGILKDVLLEIRGRNGTVSREVEAQGLSFEVAARGDFLEMVFEKGTVSYHQSAARVIRSPFFNNVYKVGVFGINRKDWISSGFKFVSVE